MEKHARIYVAGHEGLVGSAIVHLLHEYGYNNILVASRNELDLRCQQTVKQFFVRNRPQYVILAAAKVGGIKANNMFPAEFIYDNILINTHVIDAAYQYGVKKLLFLGSSCIYPRMCPQPIKEEYLLSGPLEATNEPYAIAKIAGIKMCQSYNRQYGTNFIAAMPTNLYGPYDTFGSEQSHVIPALIARMDAAKHKQLPHVVLWGSGAARREFLYVDDCAQALLTLMQDYDDSAIINVGSGSDVTIAELAHMIQKVVGYEGELVFDATKPDGTPQKLLDVTKINQLGWTAQTSLQEGLESTYQWYCAHKKEESIPEFVPSSRVGRITYVMRM